MSQDLHTVPLSPDLPAAPDGSPPREQSGSRRVRVGVAIAASLVILGLVGLYLRAHAATNNVALTATPKGVTFARAQKTEFRQNRRFVGSVEPWLAARIGPQLLSAYVDTVLVRPGDRVRRGAIVATLDCRSASTASQSMAAQARALQERQRAAAAEEVRLKSLVASGFVTENEMDQKTAQATAGSALLDGVRAQLAGKALEVDDCLLRAPFDGEIALRNVDPGSFVRPGSTLVSIVDRHLLRVIADVPEADADGVAPGTPVTLQLLAGSDHAPLAGTIARRAPAADPGTRTVRVEVDVDPKVAGVPSGTTAELFVDFGAPRAALALPLTAAKVKNGKATIFVLEAPAGDGTRIARTKTVSVLGEHAGELFVAPELAPESDVVVEGRGHLVDGDRVHGTQEPGTKS